MTDRIRPYLYYDVAVSICSTCYRKVEGKIVFEDGNVYLLKRCPQPRPSGSFEIALDVTKTVLASELSTRNETLSRALARLRDAGQIAVDGKRIRILAPQRLEAQFRENLGETA